MNERKRDRSIFSASRNRKRSPRRRAQRYLIFCLALAACLGVAFAGGGTVFVDRATSVKAAAQQDDSVAPSEAVVQQIAALQTEKANRTPVQNKINSQLLYALKRRNNDPAMASLKSLVIGADVDANGRTLVDITANVSDSLLNTLKAGGATIMDSLPEYRSVRAEISLDSLEAIAASPDVIYIMPAQEGQVWRNEQKQDEREVRLSKGQFKRLSFAERAARVRSQLKSVLADGKDSEDGVMLKAGSVTSEGDRTHEADRARGTFNATGAGIRIGVMSDGVRGLIEAQERDDVPEDLTILPGQAGPAEGGEGTAMLEIVHDLAPGAKLFFASAFGGSPRFAQNIRDLRAAGCDIIVDDVFYSFETPFQDGQAPAVVSPTQGAVILQAVNDVTAAGAEYFSSAGNGGNRNDNTAGVWEGDFLNSGAPIPAAIIAAGGAGQVHDFNGAAAGGENNQITSSSGNQIVLFWADPLGASTNDYDLFVTNSTSTTVVGASTGAQTGTQDPLEAVAAAANAVGNRIYILKFSGANRYMHLTTTPNGGPAKLTFTTTGQTKGHSHALRAFSVGASPAFVPYPNPFNSSNVVETFSSDGPRRIFFNADGSPKTPGNFSSTGGEVRQKPDITAADGVMVTGAGGFPPGSTFPFRFFGTSASAPHAAAIAGLLKSVKPVTQAQMRTALTSAVVDIEAPGVDRDSGFGIVMAFAAMQAIGATGYANLEPGTVSAAEFAGNGNGFVEPGERATLNVQLRNTGVANATTITATLTSTTPGVVVTPPGTSAYPDIPPGGAANNTTPFQFVVTEAAGCIPAVTFNLTVNYGGGPVAPIATKVIPITLFLGPQANIISSALDAVPPPSNPPYYTATTGFQTNRVARTADVASCANNKTNPGTQVTPGALRYDTYTFVNTATVATCVTISFTSTAGGNIQVVAYSPTFNPANPASTFLGDFGSAITTDRTFTVLLPAGQNLVVGVNETAAGNCPGCTYSLRVTGLNPPCAAAPANQPPVNTVPGTQTTPEAPLVFSAGNGNQISVSDPDAGGNLLQVTLTAANGTITLSGTTGLSFTVGDGTADPTMTFTGTTTDINNALNGLTFTPTPGFTGAASLTITTNDQGFTGSGGAKSDTDSVTINVTTRVLQLSSATYTAGEGDGRATITVTRSGGLANTDTVDYETSDTAGLNNCNVVNGIASSRCDYTAVGGTLNFAAGEASKTFTIPIIDDVYVEGPETLNITLSSPTGAALGAATTATLTINDNDAAPGAPNPIDTNSFFIRQLYLDVLNREPDPPGFAAWLNTLNTCPAGNTTCDRIEVASAFFRSPEAFDRSYFLYKFYEGSLIRQPQYDEFQDDLRRLTGFLTAEELEQRKQQFAEEFVNRAEFRALYDSFGNGQPFVDAVLARAGAARPGVGAATVTTSNRVSVINRLSSGQITRAQALRELMEAPEISQRFFNKAFVVVGYFSFLRRNPDAAYLTWINILNTTGDYRQMIGGFILSAEYRSRFGPN
jgi:Calx-beta domain/Domain of unknown function (DUF4214)